MTSRAINLSLGTITSPGNGGARVNGHCLLRGPTMLVRRNIYLAGRRTSIQLEPAMWSGLEEIAEIETSTVDELCTAVAGRKTDPGSLSSAMRVFIMGYFKEAATAEGHRRAGHGRAGGA